MEKRFRVQELHYGNETTPNTSLFLSKIFFPLNFWICWSVRMRDVSWGVWRAIYRAWVGDKMDWDGQKVKSAFSGLVEHPWYAPNVWGYDSSNVSMWFLNVWKNDSLYVLRNDSSNVPVWCSNIHQGKRRTF